jgi:hypothetical protein
MEKISHQRLRIYGVLLFLGMGLATWVLWDRQIPFFPFLTGGLGLYGLVFGLLLPKGLQPLYRFSRTWATLFGNFIAWILMTPLYYLVFTPLALLLRLVGADAMSLKQTRGWKPVADRDNKPTQLERLW